MQTYQVAPVASARASAMLAMDDDDRTDAVLRWLSSPPIASRRSSMPTAQPEECGSSVPATTQPVVRAYSEPSSSYAPTSIKPKPARRRSRLQASDRSVSMPVNRASDRRVSWKVTDWDDCYNDSSALKGSHTSSLKSSQNSLYLILDWDEGANEINEGMDESERSGESDNGRFKVRSKRSSILEVLTKDENAFETSLASLRLQAMDMRLGESSALHSSMISALSKGDLEENS